MPQEVLDRWAMELAHLRDKERDTARRKRIDSYLDAGHGACWLRDPRIAKLTEDALLHFEGERYDLTSWCVMPNHVHVIAQVKEGFTLGEIHYSWKTWIAKEGNKLLGRRGPMWQREYHDRYMRNEHHLATAICYVEENPVKAGLVKRVEDWRWSSAWRRLGMSPPPA